MEELLDKVDPVNMSFDPDMSMEIPQPKGKNGADNEDNSFFNSVNTSAQSGEVIDEENFTQEYNEQLMGFNHRLHLKLSHNCSVVLRNLIETVYKLHNQHSTAVVFDIDHRNRILKVYSRCPSQSNTDDVLEFIFENKKNPKSFPFWALYYNRDNCEPNFKTSISLKYLYQVLKKVKTKTEMTLEFRESQDIANSRVIITLQNEEKPTAKFSINKHDLSEADPILSQIVVESVFESQQKDDEFSLSQPVENLVDELEKEPTNKKIKCY
eukprot:UN24232